MFPKARSEQLTVQELPEETLVFDHVRNKAHCLNRTTASIWKHCDGRTSPAELARLVGGALPIVELALEQLASRHLLQGIIQRASAENRRSRRELLKKLAVAVTLPVIMTVVAPRAARAASFSCKSNADCAALTFNGGCELGTCVSGQCQIVTQNGSFSGSGVIPCTGCGAPSCICVRGTCGPAAG